MNTTNTNNILRTALAGAAVTAMLFNGAAAEAAGQKHHEPTGKDAFFHYQVDTTEELVAALRSSQSLRQRYARHFGIPESEVVDFVSRALVPYRLPATRTMTVYGVTRSGKIYPVTSRMKKGTKVWATRSGMPVLKWACANPLTNVMPGTRLPSPARTARTPGQAQGGNVAPLGLIPEVPASSLAANLPELSPTFAAPNVAMPLPLISAPAPVVAAAAPVAPVITAGPTGGGGGGNNLSSLLLIPLGIAALVAGGDNDNNGGNTAPLPAPPIGSELVTPPVDTFIPTPITEGELPPPPTGTEQAVPEPGTIALFALAAPVAAGMLIRRRRAAK